MPQHDLQPRGIPPNIIAFDLEFFTRGGVQRRRPPLQRSAVAVGVELLSHGRVVVADRLRPHILCCLVDIPNITFDSYDGKVSALYETWTHKAVNARIRTDISNLAKLFKKGRSCKCLIR